MRVIVMGGHGKVGSAIAQVLRPNYEVEIIDLDKKPESKNYEVLHVCIPFQGGFVQKVQSAMTEFGTPHVIVHSTVPVGTTKAIGKFVVHSPIQGQHDDLYNSLFRFPKWVGATDTGEASFAVAHLGIAGLRAKVLGTPNDTEAMKLICLARYLHELAFYENVSEMATKLRFKKELISRWTKGFNEGYKGTKWARSVLDFPGGKVGGSCVAQNTKILYEETKNQMLKTDLEAFGLIP